MFYFIALILQTHENLYIQISRYSQPLIIFFGTIGALINQILFRRREFLRKTSCSFYFRVSSFNDLLVLYIIVLTQWAHDQFNFDFKNRSHSLCKLHTYAMYCLYAISPYCTVLVCIDRFCRTSKSIRIRRLSTQRNAHRITFFVVSFIGLIYIHILFYFRLINSICNPINHSYYHFLGSFLMIFFCFLPPSLMFIFSCSTLILLRRRREKQLKQYNLRILPARHRRYHRHYQLIKILCLYIITNIICTLPFACLILIHVYYHQSNSRIRSYIKYSVLLCNVNYSTSFYLYTLHTPIYRRELFAWIRSMFY